MTNYGVDEEQRHRDAIHKNIMEERKKERTSIAFNKNTFTPDTNGLDRNEEEPESFEKEEVTNPDHYDKVGFGIQPITYIVENELDFLEGNVIKYVSRYQHKGGVNDLLKARTYIEFLIKRERGRE